MKKEVHYAGFWKRVAVQIMEQIIIIIAAAISAIFFVTLFSLAKAPAIGFILTTLAVLAIFIFNIWSYFTKGKTIGDYVMKTKLVDNKTHKKPSTGKLFGRFFAKSFISSGAILSIPVSLYLIFTQGTEAIIDIDSQMTMNIINGIIYLWMIFSFGKAGWSKEKQALHDTMSGTRYVEEKQYAGWKTWIANFIPISLFLLLFGALTFNAIQSIQQNPNFNQQFQNFETGFDESFENNAEQPELNLTPEQIEEIQKAFQEQAAQQAATDNAAE